MRQWPLLLHWSTIWERFKLALKIAAGRSVFFGIRSGGSLVSTGVLALGYCRTYKVEPEAVVIGTIGTDPRRRGEGLATRAIKAAMNAMINRGHTLFYIDTLRGNVAMLRSIEKLGFGQPVSNDDTHSPLITKNTISASSPSPVKIKSNEEIYSGRINARAAVMPLS
ncbi:GNAT family N-acetyltransferase [Undibacterium arcticum]|uniref:GNAT family N-acetyltransferase n=1 Tax=Undibacterium arcticum TaxID=1762892 RepID=UPI00360D1D57